MTNEVLNFVTYKERLANAEASMMLAYLDYKDNSGSEDATWFWADFQIKRENYVAIKDEVKDEVKDDKDTATE